MIAAAERHKMSGALGASGGPGAVVMCEIVDTLPTYKKGLTMTIRIKILIVVSCQANWERFQSDGLIQLAVSINNNILFSQATNKLTLSCYTFSI